MSQTGPISPDVEHVIRRYDANLRKRIVVWACLASAIVAIGIFMALRTKEDATRIEKLRNSASYISEGVEKESTGDVSGAIAAFDQASDLDPKSALPLVLKANVLVKSGKTDEAIKTLELATATEPNSASAHLALAKLYEMVGENKNAEFQRREARRITQNAKTSNSP